MTKREPRVTEREIRETKKEFREIGITGGREGDEKNREKSLEIKKI